MRLTVNDQGHVYTNTNCLAFYFIRWPVRASTFPRFHVSMFTLVMSYEVTLCRHRSQEGEALNADRALPNRFNFHT